jgi:diphthamide biosynthesis methyltransferase
MESELEQEEELVREKAEELDRAEVETQAEEIAIRVAEDRGAAVVAIRTTTRPSSQTK